MLDESHATLISAKEDGETIEVAGRYEDGRQLLLQWDREQFDAFIHEYGALPTMVTLYTIKADDELVTGLAVRRVS
jgi:hypothetical protein